MGMKPPIFVRKLSTQERIDEKGLKSLTPGSSRPKEVHAAFDEEGAEVLR
jgi:hypothetical protein